MANIILYFSPYLLYIFFVLLFIIYFTCYLIFLERKYTIDIFIYLLEDYINLQYISGGSFNKFIYLERDKANTYILRHIK